MESKNSVENLIKEIMKDLKEQENKKIKTIKLTDRIDIRDLI